MPHKPGHRFVSVVLLINGIADLIVAMGMLFAGTLMGAVTGFEFYAGGGWGIATIALGLWRIWASRKPEAYWFTALGGIVEGGALAIFSVVSVTTYSLEFADVMLSFAFASVFCLSYLVAFVLRWRGSGRPD